MRGQPSKRWVVTRVCKLQRGLTSQESGSAGGRIEPPLPRYPLELASSAVFETEARAGDKILDGPRDEDLAPAPPPPRLARRCARRCRRPSPPKPRIRPCGAR